MNEITKICSFMGLMIASAPLLATARSRNFGSLGHRGFFRLGSRLLVVLHRRRRLLLDRRRAFVLVAAPGGFDKTAGPVHDLLEGGAIGHLVRIVGDELTGRSSIPAWMSSSNATTSVTTMSSDTNDFSRLSRRTSTVVRCQSASPAADRVSTRSGAQAARPAECVGSLAMNEASRSKPGRR